MVAFEDDEPLHHSIYLAIPVKQFLLYGVFRVLRHRRCVTYGIENPKRSQLHFSLQDCKGKKHQLLLEVRTSL
jgi:hypothetical protein